MTLSAELQAGGIQLELLTGPLTGIYDPNGIGAMFFAVLAVAGQIERNYIRENPRSPGHRRVQGQPPADGPRSSTTTCSPSPSHSRTRASPCPRSRSSSPSRSGRTRASPPRLPRCTGRSPQRTTA
ncbi:hypothetical protein ACFC4G_05820 [Streptomyces sp. NPDC056002]|uniref:hypothetical protein n=1 Tax=Streptomyces sp. NPDC056002 TaxID=3345675 RepID=UPI0035DFD12C